MVVFSFDCGVASVVGVVVIAAVVVRRGCFCRCGCFAMLRRCSCVSLRVVATGHCGAAFAFLSQPLSLLLFLILLFVFGLIALVAGAVAV